MNPVTYSKDPADIGPFGPQTGEIGWTGVTQTPGNYPEKYNSVNEKIKITINPTLSKMGGATTFSHEAYGHALLYSKGKEHRHIVHEMKETNDALSKAIRQAIGETVEIFKNMMDDKEANPNLN